MTKASSQRSLDLTKAFEGYVMYAAPCPAGYITGGYGSRWDQDGKEFKEGEMVDPVEAEILLRHWYDKEVDPAVKRLVSRPLKQHQWDALGSFVYNFGEEKTRGYTLTKLINDGATDEEIGEWWIKYRNPGSSYELGLYRRRLAELSTWCGYEWEHACSANLITLDTDWRDVIKRASEDPFPELQAPASQPQPDASEASAPEVTTPDTVPDPIPVASKPEPDDPPKEAGFSLDKPQPEEKAVTVKIPEEATPPIRKEPSVYTRMPEQVNYEIDANLGLKPLDESDRARGYFWQRLGSGIIEAGAKGALGTGSAGIFTFIAGSEAFTEMAIYLFVMGSIAGGTLLSGYLTRAYGDWKRDKGEREASQGLY